MKNIKVATLLSLGFLTMMVGEGNAAPSWFQDALQDCKEKIPRDLNYKLEVRVCPPVFRNHNSPCHKEVRNLKISDDDAGQQHITFSISKGMVPVLKLVNPGLGKCCVFDDNGTILESKVVNNGNDGCTALMNASKNPNAKHSGIWWYVKRGDGVSLDWWYRGK